jgi:hypothetical protein
MSKPLTIDLFAEDRAHEEFLKALLQRIAHQEGKALTLHIRSARGGHGRALSELVLYQRSVLKAPQTFQVPDLLCIAIDANCQRFAQARNQIEAKLGPPFAERAVVACPDPHIERWYLADPDSFQQAIGSRPKLGRKKCERAFYKAMLARAVRDGGHPPTLGGIEFAREIVEAMDFFRAGKTETSLKHFLDAAVARIRSQ